MMTTSAERLPMPPIELRKLVGISDGAAFDNSNGQLVIPEVPVACYESVFDFGCGCGRLARQLLQQVPRPKRYLGIDLHKGMIDWCRTNLTPVDSAFQFRHHDIFNAGFNPDKRKAKVLPLPGDDHSFSLVIAWSVFTHTTQLQAEHYLKEVARILSFDGICLSTWFLFDKRFFPMMQEFQNALYVNEDDPTNAAIFDKTWLEEMLFSLGLSIVGVTPPSIRGFQWKLQISRLSSGRRRVNLPEDTAPVGRVPPPFVRNAHEVR